MPMSLFFFFIIGQYSALYLLALLFCLDYHYYYLLVFSIVCPCLFIHSLIHSFIQFHIHI